MSDNVKKIERSALYDQVWSTPMIKLCKEYGLSDVGMAKICKKYNVPRPYLGYWAKVEVGQKPPKTKLPDPQNNPVIEIRAWTIGGLSPNENEATNAEVKPVHEVPVKDTLRGCHELVSMTRIMLDRADDRGDGLLRLPEKTPLNVIVSKNSVPRALRIMDALINSLAQQGHAIVEGPTATIDGININFSIHETIHTIKEEPKEVKLSGSYDFGYDHFIKKQAPSGLLALTIDNVEWHVSKNLRVTWRDGKRQRLEEQLSDFYGQLIHVAELTKRHHAEEDRKRQQKELEEQQRQQKEQQRLALREKILAEQKRVDALEEQVNNWKMSHDMRSYVEAKVSAHLTTTGMTEPDDEIIKWKKWALEQADRLNPLTPSPASILDKATTEVMRKDEERRNSWGY